MTDRKPALKRYFNSRVGMALDREGDYVFASDIPPAILNATKEELAALAVFAEAMPGLLREYEDGVPIRYLLMGVMNNAALAAAKSTTAEEAEL